MYFKTISDNRHFISDYDLTEGREIAINMPEYETLKGLSWINYSNATPYGDKYEFGDLTGLGKIVFNQLIKENKT